MQAAAAPFGCERLPGKSTLLGHSPLPNGQRISLAWWRWWCRTKPEGDLTLTKPSPGQLCPELTGLGQQQPELVPTSTG